MNCRVREEHFFPRKDAEGRVGAAETHASGRQPVQAGELAGVDRFEAAGLHLVGHREEDVGRRDTNDSIPYHRYPKTRVKYQARTLLIPPLRIFILVRFSASEFELACYKCPNERYEPPRQKILKKSCRIVRDERRDTSSPVPPDAEQLLAATRGLWGLENSVHWVLDTAFREDESRIRQGHAQHNMAIMRRMALKLLRHEKTAKVGIAAKRKRAGSNHDYLLRVLQN